MFSHRQQREVFHFLFLERLLRASDPQAFILKGGINLRFHFASPRYSEDMDLDVPVGAVGTLRNRACRILRDPAFVRTLATYGIAELILGDPAKAKQTPTTQRFRARRAWTSPLGWPGRVRWCASRGACGASRRPRGSRPTPWCHGCSATNRATSRFLPPYIATRKGRRFASLPEVAVGKATEREMRRLLSRQVQAAPIRRAIEARLEGLAGTSSATA